MLKVSFFLSTDTSELTGALLLLNARNDSIYMCVNFGDWKAKPTFMLIFSTHNELEFQHETY